MIQSYQHDKLLYKEDKEAGGTVMKCIIFDMDGTLIDSEERYFLVWEQLVKKAGSSLPKEFYKTILGCPTSQIENLFMNHFGSCFPFDILFTQFMKIRENYVKEGNFQLTKGADNFLAGCIDNGIVCGIATSSYQQEAIVTLKNMDIWKYFSFSVFGDEVLRGKPHPEIFELVVKKSGVQKEEVIVFEDSKNGILSANSAGLAVYHLNQFIDLDQNLNDLIKKQYKNFSEAIEILN